MAKCFLVYQHLSIPVELGVEPLPALKSTWKHQKSATAEASSVHNRPRVQLKHPLSQARSGSGRL